MKRTPRDLASDPYEPRHRALANLDALVTEEAPRELVAREDSPGHAKAALTLLRRNGLKLRASAKGVVVVIDTDLVEDSPVCIGPGPAIDVLRGASIQLMDKVRLDRDYLERELADLRELAIDEEGFGYDIRRVGALLRDHGSSVWLGVRAFLKNATFIPPDELLGSADTDELLRKHGERAYAGGWSYSAGFAWGGNLVLFVLVERSEGAQDPSLVELVSRLPRR